MVVVTSGIIVQYQQQQIVSGDFVVYLVHKVHLLLVLRLRSEVHYHSH